MSDPYLGEIRIFAGNFAPAGWAFCDGQLLAISENDALFNLIGTTYGGNGTTNFALPNLQSRIPIHQGTGSGLTSRTLGEQGGTEQATLTVNQLPVHTHVPAGSSANAQSHSPTSNVPARASVPLYYQTNASVNLHPSSGASSGGGSQPHGNIQPFLCLNYIIALAGVFPPQN